MRIFKGKTPIDVGIRKQKGMATNRAEAADFGEIRTNRSTASPARESIDRCRTNSTRAMTITFAQARASYLDAMPIESVLEIRAILKVDFHSYSI